jgi:hypothetical protein
MRKGMQAGSSAALILLMMLIGGLVLWLGVPVAWLWIGSQVQGATGSLSIALLVMAVGVVTSVVVIVYVLGWLSRKHGESRAARGLEDRGNVALEGIMAVSALIAVVGFVAWFFIFSGSSPIPVLGGQ